MTNLYILCGLPSTGKSTLAKEMVEKFGCINISFDEAKKELQKEDANITDDRVLIACRKEIANSLAEGSTVVYDAVNAKEEHRDDLKTIADFMRMKTQVVCLKFPSTKTVEDWEEPKSAVIIKNEEDKKNFLNTIK